MQESMWKPFILVFDKSILEKSQEIYGLKGQLNSKMGIGDILHFCIFEFVFKE